MKKLTIFLTQILACGLLAAPSSAQFIPQATAIPGSAPEGINYQGRLEDGGFPVNATKSMVFRVHSAPVGGVLLWTSPAQAVPVALGLFSAVVPVPTTVLVGGGARYLEVQIDGTLMAPRELLNSVPYALIAKSVEGNIDVSTAGLSINANSTAPQPALYISSVTGNVGIGTGAPITAFDVGGSAQFGSGTTKSTFSATGALNTAGKVTAPDYTATYGINASTAVFTYVLSSSVTTTGNVNVQGSVGVGTPNPGTKLHLSSGVLTIDGNATNALTTVGRVGVGTALPASKLHLSTGTLIIDGSAATALTTTGSVGIGTPTPASKLHLSTGTLIIDGNIANSLTTTGNVGVGVSSPISRLDAAGHLTLSGNPTIASSIGKDAASGYLQLIGGVSTGAANDGAGIFLAGNTFAGVSTLAPGDLGLAVNLPGAKFRFAYAGTQLMTLTSAGNVGIGTTSPGQKLDVVGGQVVHMSATDDKLVFDPLASGSGSNIYVTNSANNAYRPLAFQASSFTFTQGNVGISTTTPTEKLMVIGNAKVGDATSAGTVYYQLLGHHDDAGGSGFRMQFDRTNEIFGIAREFGGFQPPSLVIKRLDGYVGIGTQTPASRLHMSSGTIIVDGNVATALTTVGNAGVGTGGFTPNDRLEVAGGSVRLTAVAGTAGSVKLFSALTVLGTDTCTSICGANTFCLAAWTSAGAASTCGTAVAANRCLCSGFGN